ncbi:MAG: class I SAM-dependent methyltransferase [Saprospiraceae bacterium]|nr:class I SAM-dependent methyltransferase [Saprospiraceae bacterium]
MAQRHKNRKQYFEEQAYTTQKYVMPYIAQIKPISPDMRILEIGCGEGGNMKPFIEMGCEVTGIDINEEQLGRARHFFDDLGFDNNPRLIADDIYNIKAEEIGSFDVIMMRDVIEHIPDQNRFMGYVGDFLKKDGVIFFGFPPWFMPYGGHQQMCKTRLGRLPYIHLLPRPLYQKYLEWAGENDRAVATRMEIYDTGISIERFNRIVRKNGYEFLDETLYLLNPNYEVKFSLKPKKQLPFLRSIPFLRNFYTSCCYALVAKKTSRPFFQNPS